MIERIIGLIIVIGMLVLGPPTYYLIREANRPKPPERDLAREANDDLTQRKFKPLSEPLAQLIKDTKYDPVPTQAHTLLFLPAPDFTLADVDGKLWSLKPHLKDGPVMLVFYYGYHCDHCVSQLFALDKDIDKFRELGVTVIAVSADPPELTRERFKKYGRFKFTVLSDSDDQVAQKYEAYVASMKVGEEGSRVHGTFVIDRFGHITWANMGDTPFTENRTLLVEAAKAR